MCLDCKSGYEKKAEKCVQKSKPKKSGLEGWQIALIIVGGILAVAIAIAVVVIIKKKKSVETISQTYGQIQNSE